MKSGLHTFPGPLASVVWARFAAPEMLRYAAARKKAGWKTDFFHSPDSVLSSEMRWGVK